jgi:hypothetical protein
MAVANILVHFKGSPQISTIWKHTSWKTLGVNLPSVYSEWAEVFVFALLASQAFFRQSLSAPELLYECGSKTKLGKTSVSSAFFLCWISNLLINIFIPINIEGHQHIHSSSKILEYGLCSSKSSEETAARGTILLIFPDIVSLGLTAGASVYIVLLLHRHHQ